MINVLKNRKNTSKEGTDEVYKAVMQIWDLRGYLALWLITFLAIMILSIIATNGLDEKWYVYLIFVVVAFIMTVVFWLGLWVIFDLLGISPIKTSINKNGIRVQNAYGVSSHLGWSDVIDVKTVAVPFLSQFVYLEAKNRIVYCMGKQYRDHGRFLNSLDNYAPDAHPLRLLYL